MSTIAQRSDTRLAVYTLLMVGVGLVMVYGASAYQAAVVGGNEYAYFSRHFARILLAGCLCVVAAAVPYRFSCRLAATVGFPLAVGLLAVTVLGGRFVAENAGIGRWLSIAGFTFQPVELAKLSLVLGLPWWIEQNPATATELRDGFLRVLWKPLLVMGLLALQPNFGSAVALGLMTMALFLVAGVRGRWLGALLALAGLVGWAGVAHISKLGMRVDAWLAVLGGDGRGNDYAYQGWQGLVALGSGGVAGVGPGNSAMKYQFLPEGHTDFIFAILGEELGFVGAAGLVVLLGLWLARCFRIARRSQDGLAYLTAVAVGCMVFSYAILNLFVVTSLMPVTGLPLPFLSYGGTAMITNLVAVGVLLNISRHAGRGRTVSDRWKGARWA